jgi:GR25 family glycosyltransferase involved in LPS biosynthesis
MAAIFFGAYERVQQCIPRIRPVRFFRPLYLAGGYVVTLEGAKKLLELSSPYLQYPADRLPNQARIQKNLQFFAIAPLLVRQNK